MVFMTLSPVRLFIARVTPLPHANSNVDGRFQFLTGESRAILVTKNASPTDFRVRSGAKELCRELKRF
jgi:hypothetical protein